RVGSGVVGRSISIPKVPEEDRGGRDRRSTATERAAEEGDAGLAMAARRRGDRNRDGRVAAALSRLCGDPDLGATGLANALGELLQRGPPAVVRCGPLQQ